MKPPISLLYNRPSLARPRWRWMLMSACLVPAMAFVTAGRPAAAAGELPEQPRTPRLSAAIATQRGCGDGAVYRLGEALVVSFRVDGAERAAATIEGVYADGRSTTLFRGDVPGNRTLTAAIATIGGELGRRAVRLTARAGDLVAPAQCGFVVQAPSSPVTPTPSNPVTPTPSNPVTPTPNNLPPNGTQHQCPRPSDPAINAIVLQFERFTEELTRQYRQDLISLASSAQQGDSFESFFNRLSDRQEEVSSKLQEAVAETTDSLISVFARYPAGEQFSGTPGDLNRAVVLIEQAVLCAEGEITEATVEIRGLKIGEQGVTILIQHDKGRLSIQIIIEPKPPKPPKPVRIEWQASGRLSGANTGRLAVGGSGPPGATIDVTVDLPPGKGGPLRQRVVVDAKCRWRARFDGVPAPVGVNVGAADAADPNNNDKRAFNSC